jgi:hypothetical protein
LIHIAIAYGSGDRKPPKKLLANAFWSVGQGWIGSLEDPAEDVFVTNIVSRRGNFLVLGGAWESAGFYLQRVVNVLDRMPDTPICASILEPVYATLG